MHKQVLRAFSREPGVNYGQPLSYGGMNTNVTEEDSFAE